MNTKTVEKPEERKALKRAARKEGGPARPNVPQPWRVDQKKKKIRRSTQGQRKR